MPENAGEDSASILPSLLAQDTAPIHEAIVHHSISGRFAVRSGQWKIEFCPGSGGWGNPGDEDALKRGLPEIQLYDLNADIREMKNVSAQHPDVVEQLKKWLEQTIVNGRSTVGPRPLNDAPIIVNKPNSKAPRE